MTKSEFALHVHLSYTSWYADFGEREAFTYALGVYSGLRCAGAGDDTFTEVTQGLGKLSHEEKIKHLRSFL